MSCNLLVICYNGPGAKFVGDHDVIGRCCYQFAENDLMSVTKDRIADPTFGRHCEIADCEYFPLESLYVCLPSSDRVRKLLLETQGM